MSGDMTLAELCTSLRLSAERIIELVETGVVEPVGRRPTEWRFDSYCVVRIRRAARIQRDLGVNDPGAALALELLDEIELLRRRLRVLEGKGDA